MKTTLYFLISVSFFKQRNCWEAQLEIIIISDVYYASAEESAPIILNTLQTQLLNQRVFSATGKFNAETGKEVLSIHS